MAGSDTRFLALATPVSGLAWSSKGASSTLNPILVKGPDSCSRASWVPALMSLPITEVDPDRGLWVAILIVLLSLSQPEPRSRPRADRVRAKIGRELRIASSP